MVSSIVIGSMTIKDEVRPKAAFKNILGWVNAHPTTLAWPQRWMRPRWSDLPLLLLSERFELLYNPVFLEDRLEGL
jgi:hypothetical protein